ncbi:LysR family transcriptional regulator [Acuticoccus mangrovi]|uniref:LysR family transcriptional regulator n=1 Tax=Acuticoccus mangrovi TaxID=2796142 RepID=A0A934IHP7_9HYPH|nr:LysR family transcriptional regulator [Acuticoccus mangrovi]MBJ3776914.1 LysR family transcriptional regulator [Acuticoccus mangrovi]
MDRLREMETFLSVEESRSFTRAARRLGVSRSTVTKIVAGLEARLGVRLLIRSTHHVSPTTAGHIFADEARSILSQVERLNQKIGEEQSEIAGVIRLGAPPSFASAHLLRALREFRGEHPHVSFEIALDDGSADLAREGLDFSIRIAPILLDTALLARLLLKVPQVMVASPAYLEARGMPATPDDLARHNCLVHTIKSPDRLWTFEDGHKVRVEGTISSNLGEMLRASALAGEGISIHPTYMVSHELESGALVRVLPDHSPEAMSIYAVYAERRFRPRRVLALLDFLRTWLHGQSDWFLPAAR